MFLIEVKEKYVKLVNGVAELVSTKEEATNFASKTGAIWAIEDYLEEEDQKASEVVPYTKEE